MQLDFEALDQLITISLKEDVGTGDATSIATIPADLITNGTLITREECVVAGLPAAEAVFKRLDPDSSFEALVAEGDTCPAGTVLAKMTGNAQAMLTAERLALNIIQRMCSIATMSRDYQRACGDSKTVILDTRKTTPGLRFLEKYAVAKGGATNHRFALYDRIMIKDNHRELASLEGPGGIIRSVEKCRETFPNLEVEVEADHLEEVAEAIEAGADYILLDNMTNAQISEAVAMNNGRTKLEISGGVTLERIPELAKLGADFISVGALTHSVRATDISLDITKA